MDLALRSPYEGYLPIGQASAGDLHGPVTQPSLAFKTSVKGDLTRARWCREVLKARRARARFFEASLFADPAWDMLLELYVAQLSQRRMSVTRLSEASGVPPTTALRWIDTLVRNDLAERRDDPLDGRRVYISLSDKGFSAVQAYLDSLPECVNPLNG
jgi:DNA-binding MarR family transcriptional regulator